MIDLNRFQKLVASPRAGVGMVLFMLASLLLMDAAQAGGGAGTNITAAIPWNQIGAKAGEDYKGDGLAVMPTESGARLRCIFQRLDGEATSEGLWLASTVTNTASDRFRVMATEIGRKGGNALPLPAAGEVSVRGDVVRFGRDGLREEYSVSMDGVRQDFIVEEAPPSSTGGELVVKLAVSGAEVEPAADGARLVLAKSGRRIAYSRLRVTDATGKELPARIEVLGVEDELANFISCELKEELAVVVNDATAVYPVRIDPTFSDANWVSMGGIPGANGNVYAAVTDGSGNLYVGGDFTVAGNAVANGIALWNGSSWSALGSGVNGGVQALAVSGGTVYAGGNFTLAGGSAANYVAQWNGSNWLPLGLGLNNDVFALAISGGTLYVGGNFTAAGGSPANYIAQWNGSSWSALGGGVNNEVNALAVSGGTLYAGGYFTTAGRSVVDYVAQWNGSTWSSLGLGVSGGDSYGPSVLALAVSGGTLYAGGDFTEADGSPANYIAQWNGNSWSPLGSGIGGGDPSNYQFPSVNALAVSGGTVYAGGYFTTAGGSAANSMAQWNGTNWSPLGSGIDFFYDPSVYALAVSGGALYAGGQFTQAGESSANYVAQWNGNTWSALGSGMNNEVSALAVSGSMVYAGGYFTTAGSSAANYVAHWNGSAWSALGSGMNNLVFALAASGSTLYAGGYFTTAGGSPANYIAQWNGSNWSPLDSGMNGYVYALAVSGSTVYAGGYFTTAGGSAANYIAQWNGSTWSALGSGMDNEISALAVSAGTLYAAGNFTEAGGAAASCIAQWNGSSWSPLGSGIGGSYPSVYALAVSGGTLYAGGYFTAAGDINANDVAQWNGSSWSALGSGINGTVDALAASSSTLYAGGNFTTAGGSPASYIAQWNGSSWLPLGSGVNNSVFALALSGSTLYAGGDFTIAGTNVSGYVAMAKLAETPVSLAIITTNAAFGFANGLFGFDVSGPIGSNVVIQASTDLRTWVPLQTNALTSGLLYFSDVPPPTNAHRFYRAQLSP